AGDRGQVGNSVARNHPNVDDAGGPAGFPPGRGCDRFDRLPANHPAGGQARV
ncbi:uncharacterized protein METZ01_LOCUS131431, partial [marine metagenome]